MWAYRISVYGSVIFALAYPLVSGTVLVRDWNSGVGEIYPVAPWSLFCFVPNREADFAVRLTAVDGRNFDRPPFFEELDAFDEHQKTVARGIIDAMGSLAADGDELAAFEEQRRLFERNFLVRIAPEERYELVRREYDVLQRWRTRVFQHVELLASLEFHADAEGP